MSTKLFNYTSNYELSIDESDHREHIYFSREAILIPGRLTDTQISVKGITCRLLKNKLQEATRGLIAGLDLQQFPADTDDFNVSIASSVGTMSTYLIAPNFTGCKQILKVISIFGLGGVNPAGALQLVISLLSINPESRDHIKQFISIVGGKMAVLPMEPLYERLYRNFVPRDMLEPEAEKAAIEDFKQRFQGETVLTVEDLNFILCIFAMSMSKTVDNEGFYNQWLSRRKQAYEGAYGITINPLVAFPYYLITGFRRAVDVVEEFRPLVLNCLLSAPSQPGYRHILDMLAYSQMTLIGYILSFLRSPVKTLAHVMPEVLDDMKVFSMHYNSIKQLYQDNWKYYKLYEPESSYFSRNKLPYLSAVALIFAKENKQVGSYAGDLPAGSPFTATLATNLKTTIPSSHICIPKLEMYEEQLRELGVTIKGIEDTLKLRLGQL